MNKITTSLVKDLRKRTGAGMMACKKALTESNGNIELAIENMRKSNMIIAAKKTSNIATEGVIITKIDGNYGIILEINCQTDFIMKNSSFQEFSKKIADFSLTRRIIEIETLKAQFEETRINLVAKTGENINIRRISSLQGAILSSYQHGSRIGVLVAAQGQGANKNFLKQLAMHIAASNPEFINPEDVPVELLKKEHQIQFDIAMQSGKSKEIIEKIVEGRVKKFTNEISLSKQAFVMDPRKSVSQMLKENNVEITGFIRFEVGEGIEKNKSNFAVEMSTISRKNFTNYK